MKLNKNIAISETGFIFNSASGDSFSTNPIGLQIVNLLKENKSPEEIVKSLTEVFAVDAASLEKDLSDFLEMLRAHQLLSDYE